jgi:hypothetical protein
MIYEEIKRHSDNKNYVKITRVVAKGIYEVNRGYIIDYSESFVLLQETDDFLALGYIILPISDIEKIRFGKNEQYYKKIMIWEGEAEKISIRYNVNLTNWKSIFKSIKGFKLNAIIECEDPEIDSFTIGPIIKITPNSVYIQYFDPIGFLDEKPTSIDFENITKVTFDDRYINTFSKYLRTRKVRK